MEGRRDRVSPCTKWFERVKQAYNARSLELNETKVMCMDCQEWKDFVNGTSGGVNV